MLQVPNSALWGGNESVASIDKLRTLSLSKCNIAPEQTSGFGLGNVEGLTQAGCDARYGKG